MPGRKLELTRSHQRLLQQATQRKGGAASISTHGTSNVDSSASNMSNKQVSGAKETALQQQNHIATQVPSKQK